MVKKRFPRVAVKVFGLMLAITILIIVTRNLISPLFVSPEDNDWVRVTHIDYGFSYEYPDSWSNQFFDDSGYKGSKETKAQIFDSIYYRMTISVLIMPFDNPIADNIPDWNRIRWKEQTVLVKENINGHIAWRTLLHYDSGASREIIYFNRDNDFVIIMVDGHEGNIERFRNVINRFLISFDPFAYK